MDALTHHGPVVAIVIISACYFVFALQMFMQTPRSAWKKRGPRAILALVAVFVLCAASGYVLSLLPANWQGVRDGAHWLLAGAALWLVVTNQSAFIARMMDTSDD